MTAASRPLSIADVVNAGRKYRGWSAARLATEAGVSKTAAQELCRGVTRRPNPSTLAAIELAFGWPKGHLGGLRGTLHGHTARSDQARLGGVARAAKRAGVTVEEYDRRRACGEKWCGVCCRWLRATLFGKDKRRYDGLTTACGDCKRARDDAWEKAQVKSRRTS